MSVINQVLLNLERRRASAAERGVLPDHVQVLPEGGRVPHWGWVAAGVVAALAVLAWGACGVMTSLKLSLCRTFWHYLGGVWIFLFALVTLY